MDEINLHFTGDFHAITSAHNLLSAMLDNHLHQGNALGIDPRRITWPRTMDMNDRALRSIVISLGGINAGPVREERFVIVPGSEIMAILALATDLTDLEARHQPDHRRPHPRPEAGHRGRAQGRRRDDAAAQGRDPAQPGADARGRPGAGALRPVRQHRARLQLARRDPARPRPSATSSSPRPGFGADLGAEKFFDIKCRFGGLKPEAAIVVATVRALKMHGGVKKDALGKPDVRGAQARHGEPRGPRQERAEVRRAGGRGAQPLHLGHRGGDRRRARGGEGLGRARGAERRLGQGRGRRRGGGAGRCSRCWTRRRRAFKPLYDAALPIKDKIETIAAGDLRRGRRGLQRRRRRRTSPSCEAMGLGADAGLHGQDPVLVLSDDPTKLGRPTGFRLTIRDVYPSAGAGFVVALAGDIMTMPGLSKTPVRRSDPGASRRHHRGPVLMPIEHRVDHRGAPRHRPLQPGASRADGLLFTAGQVGLRSRHRRAGGRRHRGADRAGARRTSAPFSRPAAASLSQVVKTTVFLVDMADFAAMNEVYAEAFGDAPAGALHRGRRRACRAGRGSRSRRVARYRPDVGADRAWWSGRSSKPRWRRLRRLRWVRFPHAPATLAFVL